MYGVPKDLNLAPFVGATLDVICLSIGQIQFVFGGDPWKEIARVVAAEGHWELRDAESAMIDMAVAHEERDTFRVHRLLSRTITDTRVSPPDSFTFVFDDGCTLTFVDDTDQYESCHVCIGDREIHI